MKFDVVYPVSFILVPHTLHVAVLLLQLFTKLVKAKRITKGTAAGGFCVAIVRAFFDE